MICNVSVVLLFNHLLNLSVKPYNCKNIFVKYKGTKYIMGGTPFSEVTSLCT